MTKGIESKSKIYPIDSIVGTIEEVAKNAELSPQELSELLKVLGGGGVDRLVSYGLELLSNDLGDNWRTERVYDVICGLSPGNFHPKNKK